jgi:O-methyltransferase involved in polyketide biosynthesis
MSGKIEEQNQKDYNSISPSAKSLLLMKGHTNIPYARQTAGLIQYPKDYKPDFKNRDMTFWARTMHFENRYWSIDQLLSDLPITNILELSSGFSFRGLDITRQNQSYYIDTDLPEVITTKKEFISTLKNNNIHSGKLELLPLNALDEKQFNEVVNRFPAGEIVILNEGLLMYLDNNEKETLLKIIHDILKERGGYWITADIYLKNKQEKLNLNIDSKTKEFFEQHRLEDNKFESFEDAEAFFGKFGFVVDREATVKRSKLSSMKYFRKCISLRQLIKMRKAGKMQNTWRLKVEN